MPGDAKKCSPLALAFVEHYTTPGDPAFGSLTDAVLAAGYKCKTRQNASRVGVWLRNTPKIAKLLEKREKEHREQLKKRALPVAAKMFELGEAGDVGAAKVALQWAGELKEQHELGGTNGAPISVVFNLAK